VANLVGLLSLVLNLGYFSLYLICNNVFFFSDPIGPADLTGLCSFKILRVVMSAFCCWLIECVWNKISLYELLILLILTSLFFLSPASNSTRKSKHFQMWKIGSEPLSRALDGTRTLP